MTTVLPSFFVDNLSVNYTDTHIMRGNTVSDIRGDTVIAFNVKNCHTLRAKNNKAIRINSDTNDSTGFKITNCFDVLMVYSVASRCDTGFEFSIITTLNVYNLTAHNCTNHIITYSSGIFRNIALSSYEPQKTYKNCTWAELNFLIITIFFRFFLRNALIVRIIS